MTNRWTSEVARRPLMAGFLGLFGIAVAGGAAIELPSLFRRRYKPTPYDDLLDRLTDRGNAIRLGRAVLATTSNGDAQNLANALRAKFGDRPLADLIEADVIADHLIEIGGWVLPENLALLCALSAKAS